MSAISVHPGHPFAGGPHLMGVVNVTPDSFSDGGKFLHIDKAIEHGFRLAQEGALILDVGGESTRPGAQDIDPEEEKRRVIPVIQGLKGAAPWLSIDSRNSKTMAAALAAGANVINDISALRHDIHSIAVAAEAQVPVILMHMQGTPGKMQKNPSYKNAVKEIFDFLSQQIAICKTNRIDKKWLICDPGIGFGKTLAHNLVILSNIRKFHDLGVPLLLGASRKRFISDLCGGVEAGDRLPGSLASILYGAAQGVQIFRVHDVKESQQALQVYRAISSGKTAS